MQLIEKRPTPRMGMGLSDWDLRFLYLSFHIGIAKDVNAQ